MLMSWDMLNELLAVHEQDGERLEQWGSWFDLWGFEDIDSLHLN